MRQLKITKSITNRESASLDKYLQEIGHEDLISVEEEVELAQRIKKGDRKALERLTKANLRFVVSVAKQYQNQGLSLPDLINEGNLGLIKAAQKFDETRGFKFISYAVWWIRQSILQAIAEQSRIVRLPLNQVGSVNKINRVLNKFEQENERRPSLEEIADKIDLPEDKIIDAMKVNGRHVSVDAPFIDGEDNSLLDVINGNRNNNNYRQKDQHPPYLLDHTGNEYYQSYRHKINYKRKSVFIGNRHSFIPKYRKPMLVIVILFIKIFNDRFLHGPRPLEF